MLSSNLRRLGVFADFRIDPRLPKHQNRKSSIGLEGVQGGGDRLTTDNIRVGSTGPWTFNWTDNGLEGTAQQRAQELKFLFRNVRDFKPTIKNRLKYWMVKTFINFDKKDFKNAPQMEVSAFFEAVKNSFDQIDGSKEVEKHYRKNMEQAIELGQTALQEKLAEQLEVILNECRLKEGGVKKYITEEQVVRFYKHQGTPKHLKMSYIENFTRVIPSDIIELKKKADALEVFDNYVIMHYDPEDVSSSETKKQKEEREKDPILFGIMQNSTKLYFIADWVDEYCDLTLDKLLDTLGEKATTINNKTINSHMGL